MFGISIGSFQRNEPIFLRLEPIVARILVCPVLYMSKARKGRSETKNWSKYVTEHSFALQLEEGVFTWDDPRKIAASLKKSAEESLNRKGIPFQSAMSMLNFYINRAGKNLKPARKRILKQVKIELRKLFNKK